MAAGTGVHRRNNQVAGLGGGEDLAGAVQIADLAHQNDVGSWRRIALRPSAKEKASPGMERWLIRLRRLTIVYSIGSSSVAMWRASVRLRCRNPLAR